MSIWLCEYSVFFALSPRGHKYFVFVLKIKIYFCKINFLSDSLFVEFCCAYFFLAGPKFAYQQRVSFVSSSCLMGPKTVRDMCLGTQRVKDVFELFTCVTHLFCDHLQC